MPWRRAASAFSRMPPTGSTRPESVISPVIATSASTGTPRAADTIAVAIVTPADGPSLGIAPAGTWMWRSCLAQEIGRDAELARLLADVAERRARRLLHDAAELTGQGQLAGARHQRGFDEEHVAAGLGPGHAGGDARARGAERVLRPEPRRPEIGFDLARVDDRRVVRRRRDPRRDLARDRADLPLERPHAGFARVFRDHPPQRVVGDRAAGRRCSPFSSSCRGTR